MSICCQRMTVVKFAPRGGEAGEALGWLPSCLQARPEPCPFFESPFITSSFAGFNRPPCVLLIHLLWAWERLQAVTEPGVDTRHPQSKAKCQTLKTRRCW